jgi:hypothetical protein
VQYNSVLSAFLMMHERRDQALAVINVRLIAMSQAEFAGAFLSTAGSGILLK